MRLGSGSTTTHRASAGHAPVATKAALVGTGAVIAYFVTMILVVPPIYLDNYTLYPTPTHTVTVSDADIALGESFHIQVDVTNGHDHADLLINSVGFPSLEGGVEGVEITGYNFHTPPVLQASGDTARLIYGNGQPDIAYPSIRSTSDDVVAGEKYRIELIVTPTKLGDFEVHVKTAALPHSHDAAHYPHSGPADAQGETVDIYTVNVSG